MKTVKLFGGLAAVVVIVGIIAGYLLVSNLDGIIKGVIEDVGTELTQTRVSLDGVKLDLSTGKGQINGLTIANPGGFSSDYAFRLEKVKVGLNLKSLTGPVIVISEVSIDGAKLIAEQKGATTNLSELLKNVEESSSKTDPTPGQPQDSSDPTDIRLMMEKFAFINTKGTIITEKSGEKSLKLPDVRRQNIGSKSAGLTPEQLANELLQAVIRSVEKAVGNYLAELAKEAATEKLKEKIGLDSDSKVDGLKSLFKKKE